MSDEIGVEREDGVAVLRIRRPPANALELGVLDSLNQTLEELAEDASLAALVVTGAGSCFSAGLDLKIVPGYDAEQQRRLVNALNRVFTRLYGLPVPTVAAVNGHALAGGLLLALACDGRIGTSEPCKLGLTEVRVGVPYPVAALRLARAELSHSVARQLVLSGDVFAPDKALRLGVLDEVVSKQSVLARALERARVRAELPRSVYAATKRQLRGAALREMEASLQGAS